MRVTYWRADLQYGRPSQGTAEPTVVVRNACDASPTLARIKPLESDDIVKMVSCWRKTGFL